MGHTTKSSIKSDISAIECTADSCSAEVALSDERFAAIEFSRGISAYIKKGEGKLIIKQKKGLLSRILRGESKVKILVPGHIVPHLSFKGGKIDLSISDGIYGNVEYGAEAGSVSADNAAAESFSIKSAACTASITSCTVRENIFADIAEGSLTLDYTFATHIAARIQRGNIGAVELNCRDTIWETAEGNITATILGDEEEFNTALTAREGTCNKPCRNESGAAASLKAFAAKGNIFIDFICNKESI